MKDQELIDLLKQQAKEIADANINGYGNTMLDAANRLEQLVSPLKVYVVEGYDSLTDSDEIKGIFSTSGKALKWMKENNYSGEPTEYEII